MNYTRVMVGFSVQIGERENKFVRYQTSGTFVLTKTYDWIDVLYQLSRIISDKKYRDIQYK